ncbi:MAG: hypothetical protein MRZ36_03755 [Eubacterium sp.]|nr:hypothetical protein [Eubacterium sp.]
MKRLKSSIVSLCLMLMLSIMAPVQVQPVSTTNPVSIQKVVQVDARLRKKPRKRSLQKRNPKRKQPNRSPYM